MTEQNQALSAVPMRVGLGYDVHAFAPDRKLILGGVEIPHHQGLLGHSDADVLAHAVADALLGAIRGGDIGKLFPDTDPAYEEMCIRDRCIPVREAPIDFHKTYVVSRDEGRQPKVVQEFIDFMSAHRFPRLLS